MSGKKLKKVKKSRKISLRNKADKIFSIYIRRKYANFQGYVSCYTCGKTAQWEGEGMQCGHYVSRARMNTRYDEANARVQCYGCNVGRGGNYPEYSVRLVRECGVEILEELTEKGDKIVKLDEKWYENIIENIELLTAKLSH